jgi:hypothetical protein
MEFAQFWILINMLWQMQQQFGRIMRRHESLKNNTVIRQRSAE